MGHAAIALAKIGDERAIEPLIRFLKEGSVNIRLNAARTLGELGDKRAVTPLTEALKDHDYDVCVAVAIGLERIKRQGQKQIESAAKPDSSVKKTRQPKPKTSESTSDVEAVEN